MIGRDKFRGTEAVYILPQNTLCRRQSMSKDHTVPAILNSRISPSTCSTRLSKCPCAYCSLVSASRNCCTCAILEYASAQNRSWIFTNASKEGSRYGTRRSMSCGNSEKSWSFKASYAVLARSDSLSARGSFVGSLSGFSTSFFTLARVAS